MTAAEQQPNKKTNRLRDTKIGKNSGRKKRHTDEQTHKHLQWTHTVRGKQKVKNEALCSTVIEMNE